MERDIALLMTASIDPKSMNGAFFSTSEREKLYLASFHFYLNLLKTNIGFQKIVFCENSGFDLINFQNAITPGLVDHVELISLNPKDFNIERGKGYNEQLMIDKVFELSSLIGSTNYIFKVTGRYPIHNIKNLLSDIRKVEGELNLFCDQKDHSFFDFLNINKSGHYGETRFYFVNKNFYCDNFRGRYLELNKNKSSEILMYEVAKAHYNDPTCQFRFSREAKITLEADIPLTFLGIKVKPKYQKLFWQLYIPSANLLRILFPWFWF